MKSLWLGVLAVAACGEVKVNHLADAPPADTPPDGTPHGMVTVTVLDPNGQGGPAIGAPVVFVDANGAQKVPTGNDGKASADVLAGASVSAVLPEGTTTFVESILDVQPGDNLTLGDVNNPIDPGAGSFTVNWNGTMGQNYEVFGPCGEQFEPGPTATFTFALSQSCVTDPMDLLIVVLDANDNIIGYAEKPNVKFVSGGNATVPTTNPIGFSTFNANYTNLTGVGSVNLQREAPDGFGFGTGTGNSVTGATLPLSIQVPLTQNALLVNGFSQAGNSGARQTVTENIPGNSTTFGFDTDSQLLGWIGQPAIDVTSNVVTIPYDQSTTSKDPSDIFFSEFSFQRPAATDAGQNQSFIWLVFQAQPATFTLPQLPADVGNVNLQAGDMVGFTAAGALETDGFADYNAARQDPFAAFEKVDFGTPSRLPTGTTKVRVSQSPQLDFTGHMSRK